MVIWFSISTTVSLIFLIKTISTTRENFEFDADFLNFITGAKILNEGNAELLYDGNLQIETQKKYFEQTHDFSTILGFRSLPFVAVLLQPFVILDFILALKVFVAMNVILLLATIYIFRKNLNTESRKAHIIGYLWDVMLLFTFVPFTITNRAAQITPWMAISVGLTYIFMYKKRSFAAGIASAMLLIKPQYIIIYPFFLMLAKNKKSYLLGLCGAAFLLISVGWFYMPIDYLLQYAHFLFASENLDFGTVFQQMSSFQGIYSYISTDNAFLLTKITVGILYPLFLWLFYKYHKKISLEEGFFAAILISLSLALHTYAMDHLILIFPIIALLKSEREKLAYGTLFISNLILINLHTIIPICYLITAYFVLNANHNMRFKNTH